MRPPTSPIARRSPRAAALAALLAALAACGPASPGDGMPKDDGERVAATSLTPAQATADAALEKARTLTLVGAKADPPAAMERLSATFGSAPAVPEAALLLARAAFRSDQPARCRTALDAWFAHEPADKPEWSREAWMLRGLLLEREGKAAEAVVFHQRSLAVSPDFAVGELRLGAALAESGQEAAALTHVERAIAQMPALLEAHFLRARLLRKAGRTAEADAAAEIHRLLNQASDNSAMTREAVRAKLVAYERLEKLLPDWVDGRLQLTRLQMLANDRERALERMRALLVEHGDSREGWALLIEMMRKWAGDGVARREIGELVEKCQKTPPDLAAELKKAAKEGFPR